VHEDAFKKHWGVCWPCKRVYYHHTHTSLSLSLHRQIDFAITFKFSQEERVKKYSQKQTQKLSQTLKMMLWKTNTSLLQCKKNHVRNVLGFTKFYLFFRSCYRPQGHLHPQNCKQVLYFRIEYCLMITCPHPQTYIIQVPFKHPKTNSVFTSGRVPNTLLLVPWPIRHYL